jgi:hypothetical protein
MPEQSHSEARERCPVLENLEPGVVFSVENAVYADFDPKPLYRMGKI